MYGKKKRNFLLITIFVLVAFMPLIYAGNYGAGEYGADLYGSGEVAATTDDTADTGGGGGGGGGGYGGCHYNWVCTNWFPAECSIDGVQERICMNKGTCIGTKEMPEETRTCDYAGLTEPLFDIYVSIPKEDKKVCAIEKLDFNVILENYGKIDYLDVFLTYFIVDENNKLIAESKETRAMDKGAEFNMKIDLPEDTPKGLYRLYVQIDYDKDKTALGGESFEIKEGKECEIKSFLKRAVDQTKSAVADMYHNTKDYVSENPTLSILIAVISIFVLIIIILLVKIIKRLDKFKGIKFKSLSKQGKGKEKADKTKAKTSKLKARAKSQRRKNELRKVRKKKVYTDSGDYVGKVKEIILKDNKIDSLKVRLDKKIKKKMHKEKKVKGIIIKYKDVRSTKDIAIIRDKVLDKVKLFFT